MSKNENPRITILDETILKVLAEKKRNESEIIKEITYDSMYPCLLHLEQEGFITSRWDSRRIKQYEITQKGLIRVQKCYDLNSISESLSIIDTLRDDLSKLQKRLVVLGIIT